MYPDSLVAVDDEVRRLSDKRQVLLGERDAKLAAVEERTGRDLRPLLFQLDAARRANDAERYIAIKRRIASVNGRAEKERARADGDYKAELSRVEEAAENLADERFRARRKTEEAIKSRIDEEDEREHTQVAEASRKQNALVKEIGELREAEAGEISNAALKRKQRDAIDAAIQQEEQKHRTITAESQLHRIASPIMSWWSGTNHEPHTVTDVDVRRVALVWFGSMALLGAWGGAAVAMVSQLLAKGAEGRGSGPAAPASIVGGSRLLRFLVTLRLLRSIFPRRPRTVEVIKTRREIVAVPVPVSGVFLDNSSRSSMDCAARCRSCPSRRVKLRWLRT